MRGGIGSGRAGNRRGVARLSPHRLAPNRRAQEIPRTGPPKRNFTEVQTSVGLVRLPVRHYHKPTDKPTGSGPAWPGLNFIFAHLVVEQEQVRRAQDPQGAGGRTRFSSRMTALSATGGAPQTRRAVRPRQHRSPLVTAKAMGAPARSPFEPCHPRTTTQRTPASVTQRPPGRRRDTWGSRGPRGPRPSQWPVSGGSRPHRGSTCAPK